MKNVNDAKQDVPVAPSPTSDTEQKDAEEILLLDSEGYELEQFLTRCGGK